MRDAFGGIANLVIIVVFMTLVSGYLAFNVSYTKAFRVKNKIISLFEQYEGKCGDDGPLTDACDDEIRAYMNGLGYNAPNFNLTGYECPTGFGYCYKEVIVHAHNPLDPTDDMPSKSYYKITTQINIDVPIINKILPGLRIFQVTGDTKTIIKG